MWHNSIIRRGVADPATLLKNPKNWRTHSVAQERAVWASISALGWLDEILVSEATGVILNGHLRAAQAVKMGEATVPVRYVQATPEQEALVLASFDRLGAMAAIDGHKLRECVEAAGVVENGMLSAILAGSLVEADALAAAAQTDPTRIDPNHAPAKGGAAKKRKAKERAEPTGEKRAKGAASMPDQDAGAKPSGVFCTIRVGDIEAPVSVEAMQAWNDKLAREYGPDPDRMAAEVRDLLGF